MSANRHLTLMANTIKNLDNPLPHLITLFESQEISFEDEKIVISNPTYFNVGLPDLGVWKSEVPPIERFHPLIVAVKHGKFDIVEWLIEMTECPVPKDFLYTMPDGGIEVGSLFTLALDFHRRKIAIWLLHNVEHNKLSLPKPIEYFYTYKKYNDFKFWKSLFRNNAFININFDQRANYSPFRKCNPLFVALRYGLTYIAEWLVKKHRFELSIYSHTYNHNMLSWALENCEVYSSIWLVENMGFSLANNVSINTAPLLMACKNSATGNLDLVQWLIEKKGVPLDVQDKDGRNALIYAVQYDNFAIAKYLVEQKGFALDVASTSFGTRLIHYAVFSDSQRILEWLQKKGCPLDVANNYDQTIVNFAFEAEPSFQNEVKEWLCEINIFSHAWARQAVLRACLSHPTKIYTCYKDVIPTIFSHIHSTSVMKYWIGLLNIIAANFTEERDSIFKSIIEIYEQIQGPNFIDWFLLFKDTSSIKSEIRNECKLILAEMLLAKHFEMEEEDSPLNNVSLLKKNDGLLKRALQAYYLIEDVFFMEDGRKQQYIGLLKNRLKQILITDGKFTAKDCKNDIFFNPTQEEITRGKKIKYLYRGYTHYKEQQLPLNKMTHANAVEQTSTAWVRTAGLLFDPSIHHKNAKSPPTLMRTVGLLFSAANHQPKPGIQHNSAGTVFKVKAVQNYRSH